jgi:hypothetical protein
MSMSLKGHKSRIQITTQRPEEEVNELRMKEATLKSGLIDMSKAHLLPKPSE